jgi:hypothetical protein
MRTIKCLLLILMYCIVTIMRESKYNTVHQLGRKLASINYRIDGIKTLVG